VNYHSVSFWDLFRGDKYPSYLNGHYTQWEGLVLCTAAVCLAAVWVLARGRQFHPASVLLVCLVPALAGFTTGVVNASLVLYPQEWIGPPPEMYAWEALFCCHIGVYCTALLLLTYAAIALSRRT
jgi:hypothetical protein